MHANVWVPPNDRARLEHLCRYLLRPPLVQERLRLRADGRVVLKLKGAWRDGTTHLVFEPLEFLAKLAALTPRPEINPAPPEPVGVGDVRSLALSAEHARIELAAPRSSPAVGDPVQFVAGYADATVFLHDTLYGVRAGRVEAVWPVLGRGRPP